MNDSFVTKISINRIRDIRDTVIEASWQTLGRFRPNCRQGKRERFKSEYYTPMILDAVMMIEVF